MRAFETKNKIQQEDIEELVFNFKFWNKLKNSTVLITGATGLIGRELVYSLMCANRIKNLNIKVIALIRNIEKSNKVFENIIDDENFIIIEQDINSPIEVNLSVDYIIHAASETSSKNFVEKPVETIQTSLNGTYNILNFAKTQSLSAFVYLSSMEIYGIIDKNLNPVCENDCGYLDLSSVRSSYSQGKRMCEVLCQSYFKEYNIPIKIARLTLTFGAGADYNDGRVFAQFARSVCEEKNIVLHTKGETLRDYLYLSDAASGILAVLVNGNNAEAYNLSNPQTKTSIKEMAELLTSKYPKSELIMDLSNQNHGYSPTVKITLNIDKIKNLGWQPTKNLLQMYDRMIEGFKYEI